MKRVKMILSKILEIDINEIKDDTSPKNTPTWDSFNALFIVSEMEEFFKVKFSMVDVMKVKNVGDIKKVLYKYGIKLYEE